MPHPARLAAQLASWREGDGPQFERLAAAMTAVIEQGALDGARLPAERRLAEELGVSRSTVVRAYDVLRRTGLVVSRERSGTVVRAVGRRRATDAQMPQLETLLRPPADGVDLSLASPELDDVIGDVTVSAADAEGLVPRHGYAPQGVLALREEIARRLCDEGTPATPDEILVTNGSHEALSLVCELLAARGQPVAVDELTYPGVLELLERVGAVPCAVPADAAGMRPDELRRLLSRTVVGLVYLMPTCSNPLGRSIPVDRRRELLSVAAEHGALVVEDGTLDDVRYAGLLPTLRSAAPASVLRVGSVSKVAWGGLRVGWVCGPREIVGRLARLKGARDLGASAMAQLAALHVLRDLDRLRVDRRARARRGTTLMREELVRRIPEWTVSTPDGGWSLWVETPGVDGDVLAAAAARHGVLVTAGRPFRPGGPPTDAIRVCVSAPEPVLVKGAERITAAWAEAREAGARRAAPPGPAPRQPGVLT